MYSVRQLAENIFTFEEGQHVRSFLVIGQEKAVMLDSGNGAVDFETELPKLTSLPVFLINTHGDGDHIGKNDLFDPRYIHPADFSRLKEKRPADTYDYKPLREGDRFDLGGVVLSVIECPGHTPGSILLYDEANKILYVGDSLTSHDTFMFSAGRDHRVIAESLKKLMEMDLQVDLLLSCHDICPLDNYKDLLHDTCQAVEAYLQGKPETDIFHLQKGRLDKYVKRYVHGCASILTEEVAKPE